MRARLVPATESRRTTPLFLKAGALPGHALRVGLVVRFYVGLRRANTVRLASRYLFPELGVSRFALRRALIALEDAGLLRVRRRRGHPPLVTLVVEQ